MKSEEEDLLEEQLGEMSAKDLRYLCRFFKVPRGGSKKEMIARVIKSGNEFKDITNITGYLLLMSDIEDEFNKKYFLKMLVKSKLPYSRNKHTLAFRVVENNLISPYDLLNQLTLKTLREHYFNRYGKVSTKSKQKIIPEILVS